MTKTSAPGNTADSSRSAFVSHSSADAPLAGQLCERLEAQGVSCWLAPRDVVPGRPYAEECVRGIDQSASFVLLASATAISSVQVLSEIEQAHKRGKPLYTVLVGKPRVTRELDYYISRLHWIEYAGDSVDNLAGRLARVLSGREAWSETASPPSLRRTVLYRRDALVGSAIATLVVLLVVGVGFFYWINRRLDQDYRRLGYITLAGQESAAPTDDGPVMNIRAQVWLMAEGVPFRDVRLTTATRATSGTLDRVDRSGMLNPEQVGSMEAIQFSVSAWAKRLTTCLVVPSPGLHDRYRVTQMFSLAAGNQTADPLAVYPLADPRVTKEDGSPCGEP